MSGDKRGDGVRGRDDDERLSVEQIRNRIRARILDGTLRPGAVLSQVRLARELDVGRTPLREALRMLQHEGLLEGEYNRRVRVATFSVFDLEQVYAMRLLQEAMAIKLSVPRFTEDDFARMRERLDEMEEHAAGRSYEQWEWAHQWFHKLLVVHAGPRLLGTLSLLADHALRYRRTLLDVLPVAYEVTQVEHERLAGACFERDAELAAELLARHFARTAISLVTTVRPEHDPYTVREALRIVTGREHGHEASSPAHTKTRGS